MRKAIAANHDCDQTGDLGDSSSEEGLQSGEAGIEGRPAALGASTKVNKAVSGADAGDPFDYWSDTNNRRRKSVLETW